MTRNLPARSALLGSRQRMVRVGQTLLALSFACLGSVTRADETNDPSIAAILSAYQDRGSAVDSGRPQLSTRSIYGSVESGTPQVVDGEIKLPPLFAPTTATDKIGNGRLPAGYRGDDPERVETLPESAYQRGLQNDWILRTWAAPNAFSNPLYFEDRMLSRHGHQKYGVLQPAAAGVRFFATIPMLPYLMTVDHPCDCDYLLGYYRAGSCAPKFLQRPPYERSAAIAEAAWIAGGIIAIP